MADDLNYRPIDYLVECVVGPNDGDVGKGQVAINDRPCLLERLEHVIVKTGLIYPNQAPQDGLYRIDFSLYETTRFYKGAIPMADTFGSVRTGIWVPFAAPIAIAGNETLHVTVINMWGPRPAPFTVHVLFKGVERMP